SRRIGPLNVHLNVKDQCGHRAEANQRLEIEHVFFFHGNQPNRRRRFPSRKNFTVLSVSCQRSEGHPQHRAPTDTVFSGVPRRMNGVKTAFAAGCVFFGASAPALTGSSVSPPGAIDTVAPTLESVDAVGPDTFHLTFSEPMDET